MTREQVLNATSTAGMAIGAILIAIAVFASAGSVEGHEVGFLELGQALQPFTVLHNDSCNAAGTICGGCILSEGSIRIYKALWLVPVAGAASIVFSYMKNLSKLNIVTGLICVGFLLFVKSGLCHHRPSGDAGIALFLAVLLLVCGIISYRLARPSEFGSSQ